MPEADWRGSVEGGGRIEGDMYVGHLHLVQEDEDRDQVGEVSCARSVVGSLVSYAEASSSRRTQHAKDVHGDELMGRRLRRR